MAGGAKETPRQRMIGMMYLVLTALLALQVSNAVLDKFIFIDQSLQHSVEVTTSANKKIIDGIGQAVEKGGNRDKDKAVLNDAEEVVKATKEMYDFLHTMRREITEVSGGVDPETKKLIGAKDYDKQMAYTLGTESKKGKGYELEEKLNSYIDKLNELTEDSLKLDKLAKPASEIKEFANDENQKNKDFAQLNFDHTPTVACMAILSQFEQEVAQQEGKALEYLAKKVGADIPKFDKIIAVATAESRVVAAGTKYKASLFLAASSSTARPSMSTNAPGGVKLDGEGRGQIEFTAQGGNYDKQGNSKRKWTGRITLKLPTGDSTFSVEEEYTVVKPVIQIRSASVQALYLNCGNELQVDVPALGNIYEPKFSAAGADAIPGAKKGLVTVVPNRAKVDLTVSSGGAKIGTESFKVRKVPKPTLIPYSGNRPVDLKQGVAALAMRNIEVRAVPDADFKAFLPKDARYRVTKYIVTLARGKRAVQSKTVTGPKASLTSLIQKAKPGGTDRLVIEIKEVQRMNFKNRTEKVGGMSSNIFTIPLN
ncbi:MAG: gliding motility protein GldM [Flammeovirgaceae bacterium]